jgi:hypothetical protein
MATQIICDQCGEPIDLTQPYYEVTATKVKVENANDPTQPNTPVTVEIAQQFDYHDGHQPSKLMPEPPEEPPADPYPGVDISEMTIQQAVTWADDDLAKVEWALEQEVAGQNRASLVSQLQNKEAALTA